ncbi:hypothetical protein [Bacillus sp. REN16]|uniref:hypothetical protein n=1 Tax=Bacillus sp. REN16 TaxID=2887296 RepID=UPI001E31125F|nr:hypothetical protein [Bacillus sp. REN16]MCC3357446.1 hypothetical protein [Bacillus sp. REN16]
MSLKLIELQVAIPRTLDAGKIHEQLMMRGQHMQDHISSENEKLEKRNRTKVNENNKTENAQIHKDDSSNPFAKQPSQKTQNPDEEKEQHPYKGNFIDIVG